MVLGRVFVGVDAAGFASIRLAGEVPASCVRQLLLAIDELKQRILDVDALLDGGQIDGEVGELDAILCRAGCAS